MPRLKLANYEAHYQQQGQGPDVVLVHGFTSNLAMWVFSGLTSRLANRYRVTSYDMRGHGASSAPRHGYTSDQLADDLAQLCQALDLSSTYLVGHSLGGVVAMHAAARFPSTVAGVVLSDSYFPGLADLEPNMALADPWVRLRETIAKVGYEIGAEVDFRRLLDVFTEMSEADRAQLQEQFGAPGVRWLSQIAPLATTSAPEEVFKTAGLTAEVIASIEQPVIALYDEETPFVATYNWLLANLPNCVGSRVPGASHLALLESPKEFAELVERHLDELARRARLAGPAGMTA
jgi:pimeloyl-ACP methyl ester carboxylesterase